MREVSVAVPVPGLGSLTYAVPDGVPDPAVGARVLVPLGKRLVTGVVTLSTSGDGGPASGEPGNESGDPRTADPGSRTAEVKPLADVLDAEAFLPPPIVALATWV